MVPSHRHKMKNPLCLSRTQPWESLVGNLRDCPSGEQHRESQGHQEKKKKHFAEKPSRNSLSKVTKAPAQSWGLMVEGGHRGGGRSAELGRKVWEGWKKMLTRGERTCEVLQRRWGYQEGGEVIGMLSSRRGSRLGLGLWEFHEISENE